MSASHAAIHPLLLPAWLRFARHERRGKARSGASGGSLTLAVLILLALGLWFGCLSRALAQGAITSPQYDLGDLPDHTAGVAQSYPTLLAHDGARHLLDEMTFLGARVDAEIEAQPDISATGDDLSPLGQASDEDGVTFLTPLAPGRIARIRVVAGAAGYLSAFIDFTGSGALSPVTIAPGSPTGAAGSVIGDLPLPAAQQVEFWIAVPEHATGVIAQRSRFRFTAQTGQGGNAAAGPAYSGEVEDYALAALGDHAWLDLNRDGIQDEPRDQGMNGVIVKLLDGNGNPVVDANGSPLTRITTGHPLTGAPGWYEFPGLPAGNYRVQFVAAGYSFTTPYQGGDMTADSDANPSTGTTGVVRLAPGQVNPTIDAGLVGTGPASVRLASFSGRSSAFPLGGAALAAAGLLVCCLRR